MDIGRVFNFVFEDKDWIKKILIGGALLIIPIIGKLFLLGYTVEVIRNVKNGRELPLPEWDNWGDRLVTGLMLCISLFIYAIPAAILFFIPCIGWVIGYLYLLIISPVVFILFAKYGDIGGALKIGEAINIIKNNFVNILLVAVMYILLYLIALIGIIACVVGIIFTMFWATIAFAHLVGQLWRQIEPAIDVTPSA